MRIVPLSAELLRLIEPRDTAAAAAFGDRAVRRMTADCGLAIAMLDGGYVIGAGGVVPLEWAGRALAWMLISVFTRPRHLLRAAAVVPAWLDTLQARPELRRLEASAPAALERNCRFLERLGFAPEGLMRGYGPDGADHMRFARVRP